MSVHRPGVAERGSPQRRAGIVDDGSRRWGMPADGGCRRADRRRRSGEGDGVRMRRGVGVRERRPPTGGGYSSVRVAPSSPAKRPVNWPRAVMAEIRVSCKEAMRAGRSG